MSADADKIRDALGYYGDDWAERAREAIEKYRKLTTRAVIYDISMVGSRIRVAREAAGMSRRQLSRRMGISSCMISLWESGNRNLPLFRAHTMAIILKVSVKWLIMESEDGGPRLKNGILRRYKAPPDIAKARLRNQYKAALAEVAKKNKERRENAKQR